MFYQLLITGLFHTILRVLLMALQFYKCFRIDCRRNFYYFLNIFFLKKDSVERIQMFGFSRYSRT